MWLFQISDFFAKFFLEKTLHHYLMLQFDKYGVSLFDFVGCWLSCIVRCHELNDIFRNGRLILWFFWFFVLLCFAVNRKHPLNYCWARFWKIRILFPRVYPLKYSALGFGAFENTSGFRRVSGGKLLYSLSLWLLDKLFSFVFIADYEIWVNFFVLVAHFRRSITIIKSVNVIFKFLHQNICIIY